MAIKPVVDVAVKVVPVAAKAAAKAIPSAIRLKQAREWTVQLTGLLAAATGLFGTGAVSWHALRKGIKHSQTNDEEVGIKPEHLR